MKSFLLPRIYHVGSYRYSMSQLWALLQLSFPSGKGMETLERLRNKLFFFFRYLLTVTDRTKLLMVVKPAFFSLPTENATYNSLRWDFLTISICSTRGSVLFYYCSKQSAQTTTNGVLTGRGKDTAKVTIVTCQRIAGKAASSVSNHMKYLVSFFSNIISN